ncbi:nitrous oxide reductase accessory protein NosL [Pelagimonas varians]|uniref:NosL n=1 Tax=Pelagimonas varians TaxID=696760 RepID=A0A238KQ78_9RHOB|nr:nitrous oxide reductase accessory protein NosL [Pelagimonas varians]PYG28902.1 copper chaperone NosL [Pelagimonas varians]SMX44176.1 NosL [Pelagimonas varians]
MKPLLLALAVLALSACQEEEAKAPPPPVEMTQEALSFFCQMNISDHGGPKAQLHLEGYPQPIFFAQVRDMVAYVKSPERDAKIIAIYVSDMNLAPSWDLPGTTNWITAEGAQYVVGAPVRGGMGAPEIVPFGNYEGAEAFVTKYGGQVLKMSEIPDDAALGAVDLAQVLETPL